MGHLWDYYIDRAAHIADRDNQPHQLPDAAAWQTLRPQVHQQFMASLGLERLPERCDLRATVTGSFQGEGYTAEKIAYQLMPDCWGSAHFYRPTSLPRGEIAPAVLYTCGHQLSGVIGYQYHAIAWARRGYSCLIFDTIEQHDNPGDHHGLQADRRPEWISLGYSAAGGEVFNAMRALDLLLEQPGVDPDRVGVTGISGGGSISFRLAAADDRLCAVATVAGVSDPAFAIPHRLVEQHCDCMYEHNRFARDVSLWAALIAPRPLLYGFARHDNLYTPEEFRTIHRHTQARYEKLGHPPDLCQLEEYDGPHGYNHKSTTDAIHHWFDKYVAGEARRDMDTLALKTSDEMHDEPTLSVFHGMTPEPDRLEWLPTLLSPRGQIGLPESPEQWSRIKADAVDRLKNEVFHLLDDIAAKQSLVSSSYAKEDQQVTRLTWRGELDGMAQTMVQFDREGDAPGAPETPETPESNPEGNKDRAVLLGMGDRVDQAAAIAMQLRAAGGGGKRGMSVMGIEPRGAGRAAPHPSQANQLNRAGCLVGLTPTMMMVQDLYHLMPHIKALPGMRGRPVYLYGRGEGAIAMLYHSLLHPDAAVKGVVLENLPRSHMQGTYPIMGICRVMDIVHAVGLLAPLPVVLIANDGNSFDWYWANRAHARQRNPSTLGHARDLTHALELLGR